MSSEKFDTLNTLIQLTMVLKLQQLKRNGLPSLRYSNLEEYINEKLWVNQLPQSLHQAADEILAVNNQDVVRFLAKKAITEGATQKLEDFSDIIGG
ncbi:MAG: post-transcriptional regulator [Erysipelotrichaceae bacterium]|jgi:hypothetical protein|nr:post-transcriptional regulator [Erysipelotrichaceae bacterium]